MSLEYLISRPILSPWSSKQNGTGLKINSSIQNAEIIELLICEKGAKVIQEQELLCPQIVLEQLNICMQKENTLTPICHHI